MLLHLHHNKDFKYVINFLIEAWEAGQNNEQTNTHTVANFDIDSNCWIYSVMIACNDDKKYQYLLYNCCREKN